jgi:hypothetical protein
MSTIDNMSTFSSSCNCGLLEFHGIALMLLAAPMNDGGCDGMTAVVFPASFS